MASPALKFDHITQTQFEEICKKVKNKLGINIFSACGEAAGKGPGGDYTMKWNYEPATGKLVMSVLNRKGEKP